MNLRRLFKVLVLGGSALTQAECGPSQQPAPTGVGTTPGGSQQGTNGDGGTGNPGGNPGGGNPGGGGPGGW